MKKRKKAPQDVALMTGNPNDIIVVSPEEKPVKYQTEAAQAIKQLKSKLKAPDFVYIAPTERVAIDKKADKQARDIKKLVSKLSTQEVTEEDLNGIFTSLGEGELAKNALSVATSPIRAVGLLGKAALGAGTAATLLSTPQSAAITTVGAAKVLSDKLAGVGKNKTNPDTEKMSKYHTAIMKQRVALSKEQTNQAKIDTAIQKKRLDAINDIKRGVNRKIYAYNQANKGKDSIQTYSKSGVYGTPKPTSTSPVSNTAPSVIIPSSYRTRPTTSNTTIVSHREWDREKYIEEKNQLALQRKAEKYGVDIEIVENVFKQGLVEYDERGNATVNQFAMQRVNSFLANYLEEKKTVMIRGKRKRIVGETPGAVYTRTALKSSGKTKILKTPMTAQQKQKRAVITLKRKLKQKVYEETGLEEGGLWDNIHAKRARIKAGSGEKMRKPGSEGAPTKQNFIDAAEQVDNVNEVSKELLNRYLWAAKSEDKDRMDKAMKIVKKPLDKKTKKDYDKVDKLLTKSIKRSQGIQNAAEKIMAKESIEESFIVDRAAGYSTTYTAADLGIKIQGGFELHPSVTEEGGAGDIGTDKLVKKYKKDTPGEAVEQLQRVIRARRKASTQC
jgi:ribosomal protein L31E